MAASAAPASEATESTSSRLRVLYASEIPAWPSAATFAFLALSKFVPWVQGKGHPSVLKGHAKPDDAHPLFHQLLPGGPNLPSTDEDRPAQPANQRNLG